MEFELYFRKLEICSKKITNFVFEMKGMKILGLDYIVKQLENLTKRLMTLKPLNY